MLLISTSDLSAGNNPVDWKTQMTSYLSELNILDSKEAPTRILVDFMINDNLEIIVLSTSDKEHDAAIKRMLNYKTLASKALNSFEKYTLPIVFSKE